MNTLTVHGKGGHGRVVTSAALMCNWKVRCTDDRAGTGPILGEPCHIAIGDNAARKAHDHKHLTTIVHPKAYVDMAAILQPGCFVGPMAMVHIGARAGRGCIINSGAIVEHDCEIGDWCHISPGAVLCGGVTIGEGAWIGANAVVRQGITIAPWTTVGCGAVVVRDIDEAGVYVGNPAKGK